MTSDPSGADIIDYSSMIATPVSALCRLDVLLDRGELLELG
jgi:hypothetical protein